MGWILLAVAHALPHGGGASRVMDDGTVEHALQEACDGRAKLGPGYRLGATELWPKARCRRALTPMMRHSDGVARAAGQAPTAASALLALDPQSHTVSVRIGTDPGSATLLQGALFPQRIPIDTLEGGPWVQGPYTLWVAPTGPVSIELAGRLRADDCHVEADRVMLASTCGILPLWGGGTWALEVEGLDDMTHSWTAAGPIAITAPAVFALRGGTVQAERDHVRVLAGPELRYDDANADAIVDAAIEVHHALEAFLGPLPDIGWTIVPVTFSGGWAASSGFPGIGAGHRFPTPAVEMRHEVAHGWFGSQVFPDLLAPGGHWHEALATWAMARVAPDETEELLWAFISGLRDDKAAVPSLLTTTYTKASDGNKYGRGLAAMLTLDRLAGRDRVEQAMARFVETHRLGLATWKDVLDTVSTELGPDEAAHLRSWLSEAWPPQLRWTDGQIRLFDAVHPHHRVKGSLYFGDAEGGLIRTCEVSFGEGDVPTCPPPEGWAFAVVEPSMPVHGAGVVLKRPEE